MKAIVYEGKIYAAAAGQAFVYDDTRGEWGQLEEPDPNFQKD